MLSESSSGRFFLNLRARRVLYAVITEYISTGEPVGSRTIARRHGLNLSPASIRNVLADLEEAGLLAQPHPSAGRVPTDLGFRVFVDALVQLQDVSNEEQELIFQRLSALKPGVDDVVRETGKVLSSLTSAAAVVTRPRPHEERLSQIRFIPFRDRELLAVLVTRSGAVQNRVVAINDPANASELEQIHNYLAPLVENRTLSEVREALATDVASHENDYRLMRTKTIDMLNATMNAGEQANDMIIEGQGVLFDRPEFSSSDKIKAFVKAFEAKQRLLDLLDKTMTSSGVQVFVGAETNLPEVEDISVISASYGKDRGSAGTVAVVGPARMDYGKVVPLVGFTAQIMGDVFDMQSPVDGEDDDTQ